MSINSTLNSTNLITVIFPEQNQEKNCTKNGRNITFDCVFWDYSTNNWSSYGCNHELVSQNNKIYHVCTCNHTTSFALLMTADSFPYCDWCEDVLFYVSIIGVCFSLIGLSITIFYDLCITFLPKSKIETYLQTSKSLLMTDYANMSRQYLKIITTWCLTIFAMDSVYIAFTFYNFKSTTLTTSQTNSCITIGVLLHYFMLSTFFYSLTITIIQYLIFYHSFKIFKYVYLKATVFSLGGPLIIVACVLAVNYQAYVTSTSTTTYCWLSSDYSIYGVILPIAVILCINIAFFILIIVNHVKATRNREKYLNTILVDQKNVKREVVFIMNCFLNTGIFNFKLVN